MNVIVKIEKHPSYLTGGGYAINNLEIYIDSNLPEEERIIIGLHELFEVYFPSMDHDKVDELSEVVVNVINQIRNSKGEEDREKNENDGK